MNHKNTISNSSSSSSDEANPQPSCSRHRNRTRNVNMHSRNHCPRMTPQFSERRPTFSNHFAQILSTPTARTFFRQFKTNKQIHNKRANKRESHVIKKPTTELALVPYKHLQNTTNQPESQLILNNISMPKIPRNIHGIPIRSYTLPFITGRKSIFKYIICDTLASLINGDFMDEIAMCKIIDCRYPYEYGGGHIRSATNIFLERDILSLFRNIKVSKIAKTLTRFRGKRNVLIFYDDGQTTRAVRLASICKSLDFNLRHYGLPAQVYPETYILYNGYKEFYVNHKGLCEPQNCRKINDPNFKKEYYICNASVKLSRNKLPITLPKNCYVDSN